MPHTIEQIIEKKNSDVAIFLGCGPSISQLTEDDWNNIRKMDIWTSNNWFIHDEIPHFHHLEIKMHRNGTFAKRMIRQKRSEYKNVNWILDGTRPYLLDFARPEWFENIFLYNKKYRSDDGFYKPERHAVNVSCKASITAVLDIMARMNYKKIYFCGVDLYTCEYFWTSNPKYRHHDIPYLISSCKPDERPANSVHTTLKTAKFIKEFGSFNNIEFVNLSEKSELVKYIRTEKLS